MTRLPIPGLDADNWGSLLNDFLRVAHLEDGTAKGLPRIFDVKAYGARGDGTTDDTTSIQSAISAAGHGGRVFFPPGVYSVSSTLLLTCNQQAWVGSGSRVTTIRGVGNLSPVVQIGTMDVGPIEPSLSGFTITRNLNGESRIATVGLLYLNSGHPDVARFSSLSIYGNETNLVLGSSTVKPLAKTVWSDCEFGDYCGDAVVSVNHIDGIEQHFLHCRVQGYTQCGYQKFSGEARFIGCYLGSVAGAWGFSPPQYCADILGGIDTHFLSCVFEEGSDANIRFRGGWINSVIGCLIGGAGRTGYGLIGFPTHGDVCELQIIGNTFRDYAKPGSAHPHSGQAIYLQQNSAPFKLKGVTITGNNIEVRGTYGIWLDGATDVAITGNVFRYMEDNPTALFLGHATQRVAVNGNVMAMGGSGKSIHLHSTATKCCVVGNVCSGAPIVDEGLGNMVMANVA